MSDARHPPILQHWEGLVPRLLFCHVVLPAGHPHIVLGAIHGLFAMETGRRRGLKIFLDASSDRRGVREMATKAAGQIWMDLPMVRGQAIGLFTSLTLRRNCPIFHRENDS
jgi:hypothetical protein